MKKLIYLTAVLGLFSCGQQPTGLNPKNQIAANVFLYDQDDSRNFILNQRLTRAQVQNSINRMKDSFKASYIGYQVKKQLAGMSGDEVFANCISMIQQKERFFTFEYYDIVYKCLAQFKDSHISVKRAMSPAFVSTAIAQTVLAENKVYITLVRKNVIKKFEEMQSLPEGTLASVIKPGTEILKINGADAKSAISELEPYISGSSDLARKEDAVTRYFSRTISYPKSKDLVLQLKTSDGSETSVTIPWLFIVKNSSLESRLMLTDEGILDSEKLSTEKSFTSNSGYDLSAPLFQDMTNQKRFFDEDENDILVTGIVNSSGRPVCYMQLNSFNIEEVDDFGYKVYTKIDDVKQPANLLHEVKNFLAGCEAFSSPLVLDMRDNGGGDASLADAFFRLFEKSDTPLNYNARAYYLENGNFAMIANAVNEVDRKTLPMQRLLMFQAASAGTARNQKISDWALVRPKNSESVFHGPMTVAISSNCVSACENTANRFKVTRRAKIVGAHSAGTGFGFTSNNAKTTFRDDWNMLEIDILNMAFQTGVVTDDSNFQTDETSKGSLRPLSEISFLENNPVQPDIALEYTAKDITGDFPDYGAAVLRTFAPSETLSANTNLPASQSAALNEK